MAGKVASDQPVAPFDFELVEDDDRLRTVVASSDQPSFRIDPAKLKLQHRIGRGPFGDVYLATHHQSTDDYDEYHEVAVKMLHPIKEDHVRVLMHKFETLCSKCQGMESVCLLHGVSVVNGKVCLIMKLYDGSVGDKIARLKGGKLLLSDALSSQSAVYGDEGWIGLGSVTVSEKTSGAYAEWFLLKDHLQVGDTVRSRKPPTSCKPENMDVPAGTVVGLERDSDRDGYILVRVHGIHDPLRVPSSTLERVSFGLAAGDWIRLKDEDKKHSPVGILHSIDREGNVSVGFIGVETLWKGDCSKLQMAESYSVDQFVRPKANVFSPRFEWPRKRGVWATGRIACILANGCLVVKFPGRLTLGEECNGFLADPAQVERVSFQTCQGVVKKYQHLEDFHWAVRPLLVALGLFTAMKVGLFVGKKMERSKVKKLQNAIMSDKQHTDGRTIDGGGNRAWLPPSMANILGPSSAAR